MARDGGNICKKGEKRLPRLVHWREDKVRVVRTRAHAMNHGVLDSLGLCELLQIPDTLERIIIEQLYAKICRNSLNGPPLIINGTTLTSAMRKFNLHRLDFEK